MKKSITITVLFLILLNVRSENGLQPQNYSGTFQVQTGDITLTLTIKQDGYNVLTGSLKSSNGSQFTLQGMVNEGIAAGVFSGSEGSLYFEAYMEGNDLTLSLIEPDQFNMPDYDSARYLVLNRSNQQPSVPQTPSMQQALSTQQSSSIDKFSSIDQQTKSPPASHASNIKPGTEQVKDNINGYSFTKPEGWVHQQGDGQILLGSNTIPGLISVFPHQAGTMQELQGLMREGIQEEGVFLSLGGEIQQLGSNMITGYYDGSVQGEQARGYGIGILSPHGGGIFVLAVSTPQKLGQDIISAADYLARNTHFSIRETGDADLVRHFSGEWMWTNAYRTKWKTFYPDGTYSDQSEASYSGSMSDGSGNVTGNWGTAGQNSNRGRWSIQGNRDSGVITVTNTDGSQNRYEYNVFVERGKKYYREYLLNGTLYAKQKDF